MFFFFNDTATTEIYTLSLHDALPISVLGSPRNRNDGIADHGRRSRYVDPGGDRVEARSRHPSVVFDRRPDCAHKTDSRSSVAVGSGPLATAAAASSRCSRLE